MEIFGKHLFGNDVKQWLKLCKNKKREWILKMTSQTDETLIDEFINNPSISKECKCINCGKDKDNESNRISEEITTVVEPIQVARDSTRDSIKRPRPVKKGKD